MAEEMKGRVVGGEGKVAEVDGGYFGGYVKPADMKAARLDRRYTRNQNCKRKVVVIARERGGNSVQHWERHADAAVNLFPTGPYLSTLGDCNFQYRRNATKHYSAWGRFALVACFAARGQMNRPQRAGGSRLGPTAGSAGRDEADTASHARLAIRRSH
jgi:hypothetical protein